MRWANGSGQTGGGFFIPTFAIAPIAGTNSRTTFAVNFALYAISSALVLILLERGFRHADASGSAQSALVAR